MVGAAACALGCPTRKSWPGMSPFPLQEQEEAASDRICLALAQGLLLLRLHLGTPIQAALLFQFQATGVKAEPFENHSALEIAEQLTLLDHLIFKTIPYE